MRVNIRLKIYYMVYCNLGGFNLIGRNIYVEIILKLKLSYTFIYYII
jgi:hypothetical protein